MICGIRNEVKDMTIGLDLMPSRKKPCLVIVEGNVETKYATFNNDESAACIMYKLMEFMNVKEQ